MGGACNVENKNMRSRPCKQWVWASMMIFNEHVKISVLHFCLCILSLFLKKIKIYIIENNTSCATNILFLDFTVIICQRKIWMVSYKLWVFFSLNEGCVPHFMSPYLFEIGIPYMPILLLFF